MVVKVGINGFGRIGRVIFRTCLQNPDIELSAINDPAIDIEYICYLIKFDSTHGKFKANITHTENQINIDDRLIKVFRDKLPHTVPWQAAGVQYVIEASGMFTCLEKSSGHLASDSVKRVIVTAPSADVPMIILGVNDDKLSADQKIMSCASSTLYCLAPIVKVLEENYGVSEGFITSIHAMTASLKPLDGLCLRGKHWRDHRSIHQNIIPASTGSCNALAKIIPQVKDKLTGLAFRVPIVNVSVLDLTVRLKTSTCLQHIIKSVEQASNTFLQNIIKVSNEEAVSSDFSGESHSCILDADCSLQLKPDFYKIICWYENEYSYACRVVDSIFFSEKQFNKPVKLPCKMTYLRAKLVKKQEEIQTDRNATTASIECNTEVSKASTLQESLLKRKPLVRPVVLRKPISTHSSAAASTTANRDIKKRNELFKIWNDNNDAQKNAARQNRGSFFHSCISFVPKIKENIDCSNAQERLENVKREFSKMVNITEDLLKKSNTSSKIQPGNASKSQVQEVKSSANEGLKESKANINVNLTDQPAKDLVFDICGDFKSRTTTECSNEETRCSSSSERNENYSDCNIESTEKKIDSNKISYLTSTQRKIIRLAKQNSVTNSGQKVTFQNKSSGKTNEMLKKSTNTLSKESLHQISMKKHKEIAPKTSDNVIKKKVEENNVKITEDNITPHETVEKNVCNSQELGSPRKTQQTEFNEYLHKKDHNIHVIDEELQKRNIVLVNNEELNNTEMNLKSCNTTNEQLIVESNKRRKKISKHILQCFNRKVPGIKAPDESVETCPKTVAAASSGKGARVKLDLYDKLDSASATDSNNSFEITERKSQVIHITDLTNSLDDLVRLDKICRIIEISDELSDQLFSSLDQSELMVQQKKWSFRDLCERIQLDDFCNKVFGHSRS